jgi:hypothetical protein
VTSAESSLAVSLEPSSSAAGGEGEKTNGEMEKEIKIIMKNMLFFYRC